MSRRAPTSEKVVVSLLPLTYEMSLADKKPVRVRGKRTAIRAEKWNYAKQHQAALASVEDGISASSSHSTTSSSRKRKRKARVLSTFEQLPVEIIQHIFQLSGNFGLPACSLNLVQQLSSGRMFEALTSSIFAEVSADTRVNPLVEIAERNEPLLDAQMMPVLRVLNSRFCTWSFLGHWLRLERPLASPEETNAQPPMTEDEVTFSRWRQLNVRPITRMPTKVLTGPWTLDKISFLSLMVHARLPPPPAPANLRWLNNTETEFAERGLMDAIEHDNADVCRLLGRLIDQLDVTFLQRAVIDRGCNKMVVAELICRVYLCRAAYCPSGKGSEVLSHAMEVMLDPMIWSWAERTKREHNQKGEWLIDLLKAGRRVLEFPRLIERRDAVLTLSKRYIPAIEEQNRQVDTLIDG